MHTKREIYQEIMDVNKILQAKNITQHSDRINDSLTSLIGAGCGAGIFLIVLILGVIFWISREREEDEEIRLEAEKFKRVKGRGLLIDPKERPTN